MRGLKDLYDWILKSCGSKKAPYLLGILSFLESCIFIIPPEVLLLPMSYADRKKAWRFAFITTITSVAGAVCGYFIGHFLWTHLSHFFFDLIPGFSKYFALVGEKFQENAIEALFMAAFTPIPYKVFTIAAGVYADKIGLTILIMTAVIGRGVRYYLMTGIVVACGEKAQQIIEKYFARATIVLGVMAVGLIALYKGLR